MGVWITRQFHNVLDNCYDPLYYNCNITGSIYSGRDYLMNHILFLNIWEGLGFMLNRKLIEADIEMDYLNSKEHLEDFKKYNVRTTPVLVILDNDGGYDKLTSTEEILTYLKNVQNTEVPVGTET